MSLLTERVGKVWERSTALNREGAQDEQSHWQANVAQRTRLISYMRSCHAAFRMWDVPPASAMPRTWNPATCQRLWRSHVVSWRCGWWRASAHSCLQHKWLRSSFSLLQQPKYFHFQLCMILWVFCWLYEVKAFITLLLCMSLYYRIYRDYSYDVHV